MWTVGSRTQNSLSMAVGDFGIKLPITVHGITLSANDAIKVVIKDSTSGTSVVEKTYSNVSNNTIDFELTESESNNLPVGVYTYSLDWYQNGVFMCNIIRYSRFEVLVK